MREASSTVDQVQSPTHTGRRWWQLGRRAEERALTVQNVPAIMLGTSEAGVPVSPRGAMAITDAYACVRRISDGGASAPLKVYRRSGRGRERIEEGTAELLRHPAPAVTQPTFVAQALAHLNLHGEAFVGKYRDQDGAVFQLGLLDPDRVQVEVRGGMPMYGYADDNGRYGVYTTAEVVHVKGLSLDGLRGVSPVRQARESLGYAGALAQFGSRFVRNGARPSGVLTVPASPAQGDLIEELKEQMEARHRGPVNAGRIAVLSGEVSFSPLTMPLQDAEYIAQRELSTKEVCRIFGVQPWMIGASSGDSLTYATVAEQGRAFVVWTLGPWLRYLEAALSADVDLFSPESRTYCAFDLDGLLRGAPKDRAEVYTAALDPITGWLRREEVRALEDLPAEDREEVPDNG